VARAHKLEIGGFRIVDVPHSDAAAAKAVELIHQSAGELLMKGSLHTDELMREVTSEGVILVEPSLTEHRRAALEIAADLDRIGPLHRQVEPHAPMAGRAAGHRFRVDQRKAAARCRKDGLGLEILGEAFERLSGKFHHELAHAPRPGMTRLAAVAETGGDATRKTAGMGLIRQPVQPIAELVGALRSRRPFRRPE
jgi:hypothetical protein